MKKTNVKRIIWSDRYLMSEKEQNLYKKGIKDFLLEENEEVTEEEVEERCIEENNYNLECEFDELKHCDFNNTPVRVYASLGLWYGVREGHKDFSNVKEAITECLEDMNEIYEDRYGNLHIEAHHHDGCNHFIIKKLVNGKERVLHYRKEVWGV